MIIAFRIGPEIVKIKVDEKRALFLASKLTNDVFMPFDEAAEKSGQVGKSSEMTMKIVKCLPTVEDVEWYVIDEFKKTPELRAIGVTHIGTER